MPALILGISDAGKMGQALGDYRLILNDVVTKVRTLMPNLPEIQLPPAEQKKVADGGTVLYYPLAENIGLSKQLAPNAGLSQGYFIASVSPRLTVSLLKPQPLAAAAEGPLAHGGEQPAAAAMVLDFPQLVDLSIPWINEGVREFVRNLEQNLKFNEEEEEDQVQAEDQSWVDSPDTLAKLAQIKQVGELLKALRGVTSVTTIKDGVRITHRQIRIRDVP
jgi:hypothetical protein